MFVFLISFTDAWIVNTKVNADRILISKYLQETTATSVPFECESIPAC